MMPFGKLIYLVTLVCALANKGYVSNVLILYLIGLTNDTQQYFQIFRRFGYAQDMLLKVQRILNLKQAPQEKIVGQKTPDDAMWPR